MRSIKGDEAFKFTTQKEYEALGDLIGVAVYEMMEEMGLEKRYFEVGRNRRFYFASPDFASKERILVLIHGSGVVKAGQWARKLIMNESLERGTQLDYIKRGLDKGWGIVVLNYNESCVGQEQGCHSPNSHAQEEWKHALPTTVRAEILVVAHSFGGSIISEQVKRMMSKDDFRVGVVALTDSWFNEGDSVLSCNWNTGKKRLYCNSNAVWQMYAGDPTHEGTSAAAINSVFHVLEAYDANMSEESFAEVLDGAEDIIIEELRDRIRKKKLADGDTASAKSLELEGEKKKKGEGDEKGVKKQKVEETKNEEEEKKENEREAKKEVEKNVVKKEKDQEEKEKEKKGTGDAAVKEQMPVVEPERDPSDNEDSDEGVEKDVGTPERSDNDENVQ
ncbi:hypothetical protein PFISCL1PPCAC_28559 [Pristionchus fissidentatus]|uniref:Arb2 domain-containing protein n=2 Tax=Pristionchus fissidentatus TaxID=1538716 RepID=A0AAV5X1L8_9BILA|nr:hypothetical protein PFISCL1PPCAC_28559 [Pristionchus fissidentatus]